MLEAKIDGYYFHFDENIMPLSVFLELVKMSKSDFKLGSITPTLLGNVYCPAIHRFNIVETFLAVIRGSNKPDAPVGNLVMVNKLTIKEWTNQYSGFRKGTFYQTTSFLYHKTKNGLVTSTYPVSSMVKNWLTEDFIDCKTIIAQELIHPDTKFLFVSYENAYKLNFRYGQLLPIYPNRSSYKLEFNPIPHLKMFEMYWANDYFKNEIKYLNNYLLSPTNGEFTMDDFTKYYPEYIKWLNDTNLNNKLNLLDDEYSEMLACRLSNNSNDHVSNRDAFDDDQQYIEWLEG